jgi:hypothetical protein
VSTKQTNPKGNLDRNSIIKTLKYKMNILNEIIVDREKSFSKSIIPVSQLKPSVFFLKDYIISENLKIVPLELLPNISVVLSIKGRDRNYSFTVEEK